MKLRSDVLVKLQLLDNKRGVCIFLSFYIIILFLFYPVQDVAFQLERLIGGMYVYCRQSYKALKPACVFPIEVQLQLHESPTLNVGDAEESVVDEEDKEKPKLDTTATPMLNLLSEVKSKDDDEDLISI